MNLSRLSDEETARTDPEVAEARAEDLAILGCRSVIELCVGPSLRVLEAAYQKQGILCLGNDVDWRWRRYHPQGNWTMGDALAVKWGTDAVVFAPPVSRGCTGRRADSLRIFEVSPGYIDFTEELEHRMPKVAVLVLPARSLATRFDREDFYRVLRHASGRGRVEVVERLCGRRRIRKYVEIIVTR